MEIEKIIEEYSHNDPVCLEGKGNTPPENVGGEAGYEEFLEAITNPRDPEHESMLIWGESQGYGDFDLQFVNSRLHKALKGLFER